MYFKNLIYIQNMQIYFINKIILNKFDYNFYNKIILNILFEKINSRSTYNTSLIIDSDINTIFEF